MRTTISLDDDAIEIIRDWSESRGVSLGKAASELVRRGRHVGYPTKEINGFLVFDPPEGTPVLTSEDVAGAMDDE